MCNFHSCIIRRDGALAHVASNSHSEAAADCGWRENKPNERPFFVEAEWDGQGIYPGAEKICRIPEGEELTAPQRRKIDSHYQALAAFLQLKNPTLDQLKKWNMPKYSDVMSALRVDSLPEGLTEWHGYLYIREGASLTANALTKTGSLDIREGASLTAPKIKR